MKANNGAHPHRVVVVGGGFGGLQAVLALRDAPVHVTLIDRRNFHLFQPLAYQVATGVLSPDEITAPLRRLLRTRPEVDLVLGEVTGFDAAARHVLVTGTPNGDLPRAFAYDSLIVAAGSDVSYYGHESWREAAPDVKSLDGALEVRRRIATAFEAAALETIPARRAAWLTFVIAGAGPTGVELAGQIAELARETLRREFRSIDTNGARVVLVEAADRVLPQFPGGLSARAWRDLQRLGVEVLLGTRIVDVDTGLVTVESFEDGRRGIPAQTIVWAAGVVASDLTETLGDATGAHLDHLGRIAVGPDLSIARHPEIMAIGDMAAVHDAAGAPLDLPGLAAVAMQEGRHAARVVVDRLYFRATPDFRYRDKGMLATIGRARAVAEIRGARVGGAVAWLIWLGVHLWYLIGLQNRLVVLVRWAFSYFTRAGGARLVAERATIKAARRRR